MQQKFTRSLDELKNIVTMTEVFFLEENLPADLRNVVDLAIEEIFVNMVTYNTETIQPIVIEMLPQGSGVDISMIDSDVERFDPTTLRHVDIDAPLEERQPGGLGLFLVLKMVDSINYQYQNRQSRINFTINGKRQHV